MAVKIGGRSGTSEKGSGGGTSLALALGIALLAGTGVVTAIGNATPSGEASISADDRSDAPTGSRVGTSDSAAAEARIVGKGVRLTATVTADSTDCVADSYGRIQDFFRRTPCAGLHRAHFELRDQDGDAAVVAVSWVAMPDEASARALEQLMDTSGTGNVTELSRERGRYRTVRFTGDAYASHRDGPVVVNAQAEPVTRGWTGPALTGIATTAAQ
ncbi:hypothetical protein LWC35_20700 [Pseudonocardia kujensis]|uniref:hypothetical protein n=1 Tax=Pseudonocardia kujensis TaxID=1128675 RepID=UPI001E52A0AA|nr:hypothetical protein [Pseudonocardia kujensis]MCE0765302.1 hypothetical protein [Pseudonocardia kujensis]